jgi:hypothetical protein
LTFEMPGIFEVRSGGGLAQLLRCGKFSSDRSIREYSEDIWGVEAVPVRLPED